MPNIYKSYDEAYLVDALKTSARAYLFTARHYDMMDCSDYMIDKWDELTGNLPIEEAVYNETYEDNAFDDEDDPSHFLRVLTAVIARERDGQLTHPELKKSLLSIKLLSEFQLASADDNEVDIAAIFARRILKTLDQPIPGRLRVFLGSWGLAPR